MGEERDDIPPSITTGPVTPEWGHLGKLQAAVTSGSLFDNVPMNVHQIGNAGGPLVAITDAPVMVEFIRSGTQ